VIKLCDQISVIVLYVEIVIDRVAGDIAVKIIAVLILRSGYFTKFVRTGVILIIEIISYNIIIPVSFQSCNIAVFIISI